MGETSIEMPKYRSHKVVHALKIHKVSARTPTTRILIPEDDRYEQFEVDAEYVRKHNPQPGGYYVVYEDGYESFSPAAAFEDGYDLVR